MQTRKYSQIDIHVPVRGNALLEKALAVINQDVEVKTLWRVLNVNAIDRLGMTDHGPVHFQIVANIALRLARILVKHHVVMMITRDYELSNDYAELVILLASLFHDMGMSISREGHEGYSLFLANDLLHRILDFLPADERTIVTSEVLHAIISHRSGGKPYTVEAGIVRVADALDMSEGRSRIPYQAGKIDIHSVSATAIDRVEILDNAGERRGDGETRGRGDAETRRHGEAAETASFTQIPSEAADTAADSEADDAAEVPLMGNPALVKPIQINIWMNNIAGIFQVDELLRSKLIGSGIEKYVKVDAYIKEGEENRLVKEFEVR